MSQKRLIHLAIALVLAVVPLKVGHAEGVDKKWRLSGALGGYNPVHEVESNAANTFTVVNRLEFEMGQRVAEAFYADPRDDNSAFGALDVNAGPLATFAVQYGLSKTLVLEGSVGYHRADVGDVEVGVQFFSDPPPIEEQNFNYSVFRINAGEIERIPIQLDLIVRFRPRAKFNPYLGAGIGYSFIGFEPSSDLDTLSFKMDSLIGVPCRLTSSLTGPASVICGQGLEPRPLEGAAVDASDSFEWNIVGGAEIQLKRKMHIFLDLRWVDASRNLEISFDNSNELGVSVPQLIDFDTSEAARTLYGPVRLTDGGLIDDGYRRLEAPPDNPQINCNFPNPDDRCVTQFVQSPGSGQMLTDFEGNTYIDTDPGNGDGIDDPGDYYTQGGTIKYDGLSLQLGFRYTF